MRLCYYFFFPQKKLPWWPLLTWLSEGPRMGYSAHATEGMLAGKHGKGQKVGQTLRV